MICPLKAECNKQVRIKSDYLACYLSSPEFSRNCPLVELHLALPAREHLHKTTLEEKNVIFSKRGVQSLLVLFAIIQRYAAILHVRESLLVLVEASHINWQYMHLSNVKKYSRKRYRTVSN